MTTTFAISARVIGSFGRKILCPFMICHETILRNVAASIYFARSEVLLTSVNVIVVTSFMVTQRAIVRIFVASAREIESFGRKRVLFCIIHLERARDTY